MQNKLVARRGQKFYTSWQEHLVKYASSSAFRRALEDRLRAQSLTTDTPLARLRKMVAFDRFLARLINSQPDQWVLKGGFALQLRLGGRARTTKDMDVLALNSDLDIYTALRRAGATDLNDWFDFEVEMPQEEEDLGGRRYQVTARLDTRPFEVFHLDVGTGDALVEKPDNLFTPDLLRFAGIEPAEIPCYPLAQQIAEKLHAYTRSYAAGESSRVKDFVDLVLMAGLEDMDAKKLRRAIEATFDERATHKLPEGLPAPPRSWEKPYAKLANDLELPYRSLEDSFAALTEFLTPVLGNQRTGAWSPTEWRWK